MRVKPKTRVFLESMLFPLIPWGINFFFQEDPGFSSLFFLPYLGLLFVISAYYGKTSGFISFGVSIILIAITYRSSIPRFGIKELLIIPISGGGVYLLGIIRDVYTRQLDRIRERLKALVKENWLLKKTTSALSEVDRELEERVSRQAESITILSDNIQHIDSTNFHKALDLLMDTIYIFSKADKMSIWEHQHNPLRLVRYVQRGWTEKELEKKEVSIEGNILGWVFRNDTPFSIRMLLQYDHLRHLDDGNSILTYPIVFNKTIWGVLNIEKMPFTKYNSYAEGVVQMIIKLAEPNLEKAYEYESLIQSGKIEGDTRLPMFSLFKTSLTQMTENTREEEGNLSIILFEIINYKALADIHSESVILSLFPELNKTLENLTKNRGHIFHYKNKNQIAIIMPNTDQDGASLLCLEILEKINVDTWVAGDNKIALEGIIGFASMGMEITTPESMMERAEHLLSIQKAE